MNNNEPIRILTKEEVEKITENNQLKNEVDYENPALLRNSENSLNIKQGNSKLICTIIASLIVLYAGLYTIYYVFMVPEDINMIIILNNSF